MPLFSVIIPTFNRQELLAETLASVAPAVAAGLAEIIVVDDGSTDGTRDFLAHGSHPPLRWLPLAPGHGPGGARQAGVALATGDFLAFLDSDDLWFPWTAPNYAEVIAKTRASVVGGQPLPFAQGEIPAAVAQPCAFAQFADYLAGGTRWANPSASGMVLNRAHFLAQGLRFRPGLVHAEDCDVWLQAGALPGAALVTTPTTYAYRVHADNTIRHFGRSLEGIGYLLDREAKGEYPGGPARAAERRQIIGRHLRPVVWKGLRQRDHRSAARALWWQSWRWQAALGRWKFLAATAPFAILP